MYVTSLDMKKSQKSLTNLRSRSRELSIPRLRTSTTTDHGPYNLKIAAIYSFAKQLIQKLRLIQSLIAPCPKHLDVINKNIDSFNWGKVESYTQCESTWNSTKETHMSCVCLEICKTRKDCNEIIKYVIRIFEPFLQRRRVRELILNQIQSQLQKNYDYYNIDPLEEILKEKERMDAEYKKLQKDDEIAQLNLKVSFEKRCEALKELLSDRVDYLIKMRYIEEYYRIAEEQALYKNQLDEANLKKQIELQNQRIEEENYTFQSILDVYFNSIEFYRLRNKALESNLEMEMRKLNDYRHNLIVQIKMLKESEVVLRDEIYEMKFKRLYMIRGGSKHSDDKGRNRRKMTIISARRSVRISSHEFNQSKRELMVKRSLRRLQSVGSESLMSHRLHRNTSGSEVLEKQISLHSASSFER